MSASPRRWPRRLAVLAALGFAVLQILAFLHARAMTRFLPSGVRTPPPEQLSLVGRAHVALTGVRIPRPENQRSPAALGLPYQPIQLDSPDGPLAGWYLPTTSPAPAAPILMLHGYAGSAAQLLESAAPLHRAGHPLLLLDLPGSGGSHGAATSLGWYEAAAVEPAFRWLHETTGQPPALYGFSMGAVTALRAVAVHGVQPRAVIVEACFDTLLHTVRQRFHSMGLPSFPAAESLVFWGGVQGGFHAFDHNPVDYAAAVPAHVPALVIHGQRDARVSMDEARALIGAFRSAPATWWHDGGHQQGAVVDQAGWTAAIQQLLGSGAG